MERGAAIVGLMRMKHILPILALAAIFAFPIRGAGPTPLSSPTLTNFNKRAFSIDYNANPTNIIKLNLSTSSPDGPGDIYTFVQQFVATNGTTLWILTNGVLRNIPAANDYRFAFLDSTTPTNNGSQVWLLGTYPLAGGTIAGAGSSNILAAGYYPLRAITWNNVSEVTAIGQNALATSGITNSANIHAIGNYPLFGASISNSSNIYGDGHSAGQNVVVLNSGNIFFRDNETGLGSTFNNSFNISLFNGALKGANLNGTTDFGAFGAGAGDGLTGDQSHQFIFGPSITVSAGGVGGGGGVIDYGILATPWVSEFVLPPGTDCLLVGSGGCYYKISATTSTPSDTLIHLGTGHNGQRLLLESVGTNAFTVVNGASVCDAGSGHVIIAGDWTPTQLGETLSLHSDGLNWYEEGRHNPNVPGGDNLWRTAIVGSITNLQPVNLALQPFVENGWLIGSNTAAIWGPLTYESLVSIRDTSHGELKNNELVIGSTMNGGLSAGSAYLDLFTSTNFVDLQMGSYPGATPNHIHFRVDDTVNQFDMTSQNGGQGLIFVPNVADGTTPFRLNSTQTHAAGNILEVANNSTNLFHIGPATDSTLATVQNNEATSGVGSVILEGDLTDTLAGVHKAGSLTFSKNGAWTGGVGSTIDSIATLAVTDQDANWNVFIGARGNLLYQSGSAFGASDPMSISVPLLGKGDGIAAGHIGQAANGAPDNSSALIMNGDAWNPAGGPAQAQPVQAGWWLEAIQTLGVPTYTIHLSGSTNNSTPQTLFTIKADSGWTGTGANVFTDDGTFKAAGGGASIWQNIAGTIQYSGGQVSTNTLSVQSGSLSSNPNDAIAAFGMTGTNVTYINPFGGIEIGRNVINDWGPQNNDFIAGSWNTTFGEPDNFNVIFQSTSGAAATAVSIFGSTTDKGSGIVANNGSGVTTTLTAGHTSGRPAGLTLTTNSVVLASINGDTGLMSTVSGFGSSASGTITTSSTGATNTLSANVILYVTTATSATLKDNAGTTEFSGVNIAAFTPVRLQPGGAFIATGVTYATGTSSHTW